MNSDAHCGMLIKIRLDDIRGIWADVDDKTRIEIIKSIIWTAPDNHEFLAKVAKIINSNKFRETLD